MTSKPTKKQIRTCVNKKRNRAKYNERLRNNIAVEIATSHAKTIENHKKTMSNIMIPKSKIRESQRKHDDTQSRTIESLANKL